MKGLGLTKAQALFLMTMTLKERLKNITDPVAQSDELMLILDEMGIQYKKTNCKKCLRDLYNIALEEAGLIESAAEESDFNSEEPSEKKEKIVRYEYIKERSVLWYRTPDQPIRMDSRTKQEIIKEFIKTHKGYYRKRTISI